MTKSCSRSYGKLGLIGISLIAVIEACSAAASILDATGDVGGNLNLNGSGGDAQQETCINSLITDVTSSRPVDVIFVIDNSGSMVEELKLIQDNINKHFAAVMNKAGLDYRVIMVVAHGGSNNFVCIEAPLSTIPKGGCANLSSKSPPGNNPGKFYHYSYDVQSNDSLCIILDTLTASNYRPDNFGLAPNGWVKWLRKSAFKIFIEVTDDMPSCIWYPDSEVPKGKKSFNDFNSSLGGMIIAMEWDKTLLKLFPEHFGTVNKRNYAFYSVAGFLEKPAATDSDSGLPIDPNGKIDDLFTPSEGIVDDVCSTAVAAGQGYQWLSNLTGGLRFPICQAGNFDLVFEKLATSIDSITKTICEINIPHEKVNGKIDLETVQIEVETIDGDLVILNRVDDQSSCTNMSNEFYYDSIANIIVLCPNTCTESKSVTKTIKMTAGCIEKTN